jgi:hypothetical protein
MKAEELRIGNYVEWSTPALAINIKELSHKVSSKDLVNLEENKILLEPIPLTEEWLVKFGFTESKEHNNFQSKAFHITISENKIFEIRTNNQGTRMWNNKHGWKQQYEDIDVYPKYVHQLQNLYFALTGEELQSKD